MLKTCLLRDQIGIQHHNPMLPEGKRLSSSSYPPAPIRKQQQSMHKLRIQEKTEETKVINAVLPKHHKELPNLTHYSDSTSDLEMNPQLNQD